MKRSEPCQRRGGTEREYKCDMKKLLNTHKKSPEEQGQGFYQAVCSVPQKVVIQGPGALERDFHFTLEGPTCPLNTLCLSQPCTRPRAHVSAQAAEDGGPPRTAPWEELHFQELQLRCPCTSESSGMEQHHPSTPGLVVAPQSLCRAAAPQQMELSACALATAWRLEKGGKRVNRDNPAQEQTHSMAALYQLDGIDECKMVNTTICLQEVVQHDSLDFKWQAKDAKESEERLVNPRKTAGLCVERLEKECFWASFQRGAVHQPTPALEQWGRLLPVCPMLVFSYNSKMLLHGTFRKKGLLSIMEAICLHVHPVTKPRPRALAHISLGLAEVISVQEGEEEPLGFLWINISAHVPAALATHGLFPIPGNQYCSSTLTFLRSHFYNLYTQSTRELFMHKKRMISRAEIIRNPIEHCESILQHKATVVNGDEEGIQLKNTLLIKMKTFPHIPGDLCGNNSQISKAPFCNLFPDCLHQEEIL
ncbi:hypothetical protein EK904_008686 [Melospiza melodia maxima]|nr:hypothetical protein EK904_008686 [Melospiza melodia maxima]